MRKPNLFAVPVGLIRMGEGLCMALTLGMVCPRWELYFVIWHFNWHHGIGRRPQ